MNPAGVVLLALALVAVAVVVAVEVAMSREAPANRRIVTPPDWSPERYALSGCDLCRLAAEAGGGWFELHLVSDHPERYGAMRPIDRERFAAIAAARRAA